MGSVLTLNLLVALFVESYTKEMISVRQRIHDTPRCLQAMPPRVTRGGIQSRPPLPARVTMRNDTLRHRDDDPPRRAHAKPCDVLAVCVMRPTVNPIAAQVRDELPHLAPGTCSSSREPTCPTSGTAPAPSCGPPSSTCSTASGLSVLRP